MYMCIDYKLHNKCKYSCACDFSKHVVCAAYVHVCVHLYTYIHL